MNQTTLKLNQALFISLICGLYELMRSNNIPPTTCSYVIHVLKFSSFEGQGFDKGTIPILQ